MRSPRVPRRSLSSYCRSHPVCRMLSRVASSKDMLSYYEFYTDEEYDTYTNLYEAAHNHIAILNESSLRIISRRQGLNDVNFSTYCSVMRRRWNKDSLSYYILNNE